jgi:hypothetical protein
VESTVESIEPRDRDRANVASIIIRFYIAILRLQDFLDALQSFEAYLRF